MSGSSFGSRFGPHGVVCAQTTSHEACAQTSQGLHFTWKTRLRPVSSRVLAVVQSFFCPSSMDVEAVLHLETFIVLRVEISSLIWG